MSDDRGAAMVGNIGDALRRIAGMWSVAMPDSTWDALTKNERRDCGLMAARVSVLGWALVDAAYPRYTITPL